MIVTYWLSSIVFPKFSHAFFGFPKNGYNVLIIKYSFPTFFLLFWSISGNFSQFWLFFRLFPTNFPQSFLTPWQSTTLFPKFSQHTQNHNKITTKSQQNHNKITTKSQQNHNKITTISFTQPNALVPQRFLSSLRTPNTEWFHPKVPFIGSFRLFFRMLSNKSVYPQHPSPNKHHS
jgi:hypothetical protein